MQQGSPSRRLTTILALDVVGYSQMTARDEDHALRIVRQRFATAAGFVSQHEGRVFNTAGDAMLAEFASPVEAVRCALEIQEAMRTANGLADEADVLQLRIGINLGDVIVSGSDLLGDGVNIAARLEGIAPAGGVCVSASVYEQLVGKLTLGAEDLGEQQVKNIPRPIRAYRLTPQGAPPARPQPHASAGRSRGLLLVVAISVAAVAAGAGGAFYFMSGDRPTAPVTTGQILPVTSAGAPPPPSERPVTAASRRTLVPEEVPFIDDPGQERLRTAYVRGSNSKALAISILGSYGLRVQRIDDETAKKEALELCTSNLKKAVANPSPQAGCFLYAVGDDIVWTARPPPMPPQPWVAANRPSPSKTLDPEKMPLVSAFSRKATTDGYLPARAAKALAIGRGGVSQYTRNRASENAAMRAALQACGFATQRACFIFALNDEIVVQVPESMRVIDVVSVPDLPDLSNADRQRVEASYIAGSDWRALAIGRNNRIGIATRQSSEQAAIDQSLRDCNQTGGLDCAVVAIGPFMVARK